jgi:transposase, IS30 family
MQDMHKQLSPQDRDQIAVMVGAGKSKREIGRLLGFNHTTIGREIARNRWGDTYVSIHAQAVTNKRKQEAGKRPPLKDSKTHAYVKRRLLWGWSPEQISGRLKRRNGGVSVICPETIYAYIYAPENKALKLWEHLPRKQKHRKHQYGRSSQRVRIPDRVSIHSRPEEVEERIEIGHWEADSVIGRQTKGAIIHTAVERKTRFLIAKLVPAKSAGETIAVQRDIFQAMPSCMRKSVTTDNGLEFAQHTKLHTLGVATYFADPYCSGQRGTNENHNGLLRRYLPKKTSFQSLTQSELNDMVAEINHRPKKCLDYQTPAEALEYELTKKGLSGAFQLRM